MQKFNHLEKTINAQHFRAPQTKLKFKFDKSIRKLSVVAFASIISIGAQLPLAVGTFAVSTLVSTEEVEAKPGYRACVDTRNKRYYLTNKKTGCASKTWQSVTCEKLDQIIRGYYKKPLGVKTACDIGKKYIGTQTWNQSNIDIRIYKMPPVRSVKSEICWATNCTFAYGVSTSTTRGWNFGGGLIRDWTGRVVSFGMDRSSSTTKTTSEIESQTIKLGSRLECTLGGNRTPYGRAIDKRDASCKEIEARRGIPTGSDMVLKGNCLKKNAVFSWGGNKWKVTKTNEHIANRWSNVKNAAQDWHHAKTTHRKVQKRPGNKGVVICSARFEIKTGSSGNLVVHRTRQHVKKVK